jgi:hypothetical protein
VANFVAVRAAVGTRSAAALAELRRVQGSNPLLRRISPILSAAALLAMLIVSPFVVPQQYATAYPPKVKHLFESLFRF